MATVLLTGASGFVGVHTMQALLEAGHRVRAFVRTPARLERNLLPLGLELEDSRIDVTEGDMTSTSAVRTAVSGCDAVVHAAATYSFKRRDRTTMLVDNVAGTRAVIEAAVEAGCSRIVHVSSTVALNRPGGGTLDERSPLGPGLGPYSDSKVASEAIARQHQEAGAPVTIVNPGGVLGPHDPYLGESNEAVVMILTGRAPVWPRGRLQYVDVRDTAAVLTAVLEHPPGGRYLVPGELVPDLHARLRTVTGRTLRVLHLPSPLIRAAAMPGYLTGWSFLPDAVEGARVTGCDNVVDAAATTQDLGVTARPLEETLHDTVQWLVEAGHLQPRHARVVHG